MGYIPPPSRGALDIQVPTPPASNNRGWWDASGGNLYRWDDAFGEWMPVGEPDPAIGYYALALGRALPGATYSVALGAVVGATGPGGVAIGNGADAREAQAIAIGDTAMVGTGADQAIAIGFESQAIDIQAVAIGYLALATGLQAVAIGQDATTGGTQAVAIGQGSNATDVQALAVGQNALADAVQAVAVGQQVTASGLQSLAIGQSTTAGAEAALAAGQNTNALALRAVAIGQSASVNALSIDGIAVGSSAIVEDAENGIAIGTGAYAWGAVGVADAVAIGRAADSEGSGSVAIGAVASAYDEGTIGIGLNSLARGVGGISIGDAATIVSPTTDGAIAIGHAATASAATATPDAIAIGHAANAAHSNAAAIGGGAATTAAFQLVANFDELRLTAPTGGGGTSTTIVLASPDGTLWRLSITNAGTVLVAAA